MILLRAITTMVGLYSILSEPQKSGDRNKPMQFADGFDSSMTSEGLREHIKQGLGLENSLFRLGSTGFSKLASEVEEYWDKGNIILKGPTKWMMENLDIGKEGLFNDPEKGWVKVFLDVPVLSTSGKKKYRVYRDSGKKKDQYPIAMKIEWGAVEDRLYVKNHIPGNAKSFWRRSTCDAAKKMNPNKAGFWACYAPTLFAEHLNMQSDMPW